MPEELWTEVHSIVQKAVIKTIPKGKKCKKAKWLGEEDLQIAEKQRKAKGKGERKKYIHLNVEIQRTARRDKKIFLSNQCKEIEENILECEFKWTLGSITRNKASESELFKILKDNTTNVLHSTCQQIWKTQEWPQDWKRSVFIPIPKKNIAKECSNYRTIALISHARKVMLRILQDRLQQPRTSRYSNWI